MSRTQIEKCPNCQTEIDSLKAKVEALQTQVFDYTDLLENMGYCFTCEDTCCICEEEEESEDE